MEEDKPEYTQPQIDIDTNQSNRVIVFSGIRQRFLIIPVHYCFNIHNINEIDIQNSTAEVNAQLILAINYDTYKQSDRLQIVEHLKSEIKVLLSQRQNIQLTMNNKNVEMIQYKNQGILAFVVRQEFGAIFCEDVVLTPLEKLNIIFPIKITDILLPASKNNEDQRAIRIKFNLLNFEKNKEFYKENKGCEIYFEDQLNIGEYQISKVETISQTCMYRIPYKIAKAMSLPIINNKDEKQYAKITKNKTVEKRKSLIQKIFNIKDEQKQPLKHKQPQAKQEQNIDNGQIVYDERLQEKQNIKKASQKNIHSYKIRSFNTAYIKITLFRHPLVGVLTVLFPLLIISFLNYAIFKIRKEQGEEQEDQNIQKLTVIITTIAALIQLAQVIRERIPATDKITFIQILVFCQLIPSFCSIVEIMRYKNPPLHTVQKSIGIILTLLTIIAILFYPVYFYAHLKKQYQKKYEMKNPAKQKYLLQKKYWSNTKLLVYLKDAAVLLQKIKKKQ